MSRFGFVGGTYQSQALSTDAQDCINWYPEANGEASKSVMTLMPSPGTKLFATVNETAILGQKWVPAKGRYFVAGKHLWEISSVGVATDRGALNASPSGPVFMVVNATQMLICSGGLLYVFTFATNVLTAALGSPTGVQQIGYSDGFGVALQAATNTFQISAINDFTTWPALAITTVSLFPDLIVSMLVDHREIVLLGNTVSTVYSNVGAPIFPFQPIPGAYIEQGSTAPYAAVKLDNSVFWLGADERGTLVAFRSQGYIGIRVSTHAVETAWQAYGTANDAIGYSFQDQGHAFWHIYFPTANASWRYDVATNMWHKVAFWDSANQVYSAHHSQNHAFAYGKHMVGDWFTGSIYQMAIPIFDGAFWNFGDDNGNPIKRLRRAPYIAKEQQWCFHEELQVDVDTGLGEQASSLSSVVILKDSNNALWQVTINDNGLLVTTSVTSGVPTTPVLNDPLDLSFSWQLGVTITGLLTTSGIAYNAGNQQILRLVTSGGIGQSGIGITHHGAAFGILYTLPVNQGATNPQLFLRWSDDFGRTWSNSNPLYMGFAGDFLQRAIMRRLGKSRARIYEVTSYGPVPARITDAYLKATPDYNREQRLTDRMKASA